MPIFINTNLTLLVLLNDSWTTLFFKLFGGEMICALFSKVTEMEHEAEHIKEMIAAEEKSTFKYDQKVGEWKVI